MTLTRRQLLEARTRPPVIPEKRGYVGRLIRWRQHQRDVAVPIPPRKEDAPCCQARLDELGRPPLGFCSPDCIRRPAVWRALTQGDTDRGL